MTGKKKTNYSDFRINIAQQLLEAVQLPEYSVRGRPSSSTTPHKTAGKSMGPLPNAYSLHRKKEKSHKTVCCVLQ
jgi:hypothetical protein